MLSVHPLGLFLAGLAAFLPVVARADTVYVTDLNASSVKEIAPDRSVTTFAKFDGVDGGMTLGADGNLYVNGLLGVFKIAPDATVSHFAISNSAAGGDLAFDSTGTLYASENESQIFSIPPEGVAKLFTQFQESGLACDSSSNNLYASSPSGEIVRFTPDGNSTVFASGLSSPGALAFDSQGNLFVAEATAGSIDEITPNGVVSTFATGFFHPSSLAFGSDGNLFVSNFDWGYAQSIDEITPQGVVTPYAWGFTAAGSLVVQVPEPSTIVMLGGLICGVFLRPCRTPHRNF